ncbi:hypothetical protein L6452_05050 [Arctium lappa]|uniref:Uncharacterized protein n=1 Tax=Arctium lappa TaxID=4217 RepID=A0ACB9EFM7_ARCLA|nr:hypothetical protein L6452_05050 [Arctium lappa]
MAEENTKSYEKLSDPCWRGLHDQDMAIGIHFVISARNQLRNNEELIDKNNAIMSSYVGFEYYAGILSLVDKDPLDSGWLCHPDAQ